MKAEHAVLNHYHDYPDAQASSFKRFRMQEAPADNPRSKKVLETKKEVARQERNRVREQEQLKKIKENQEAQRLLRQQIEDKRKQIEQLQVQRKLAEEEQVRSYQLAKFKQQQDRDRLKRKHQQSLQNDKMAKDRAEAAFKRMLVEKEQAEAKERQAAYRRKVIQDAEREERNKAAQRQQQLNERSIQLNNSEPESEEAVEFQRFYKPLGRVSYNRIIDYSKTCLHNPILVKYRVKEQSDAPEQSAIDKAREVEEHINEMRQQRTDSQQKNRILSDERGREALRKLADQKLLEQKVRESEQKLRTYNMQKIEQGKRDQYIGIKPSTLTQMQINKKIRSEKEFEEMFFKDKKLQWINEPANRYDIANNRSQLERMSNSQASWSSKNKGSGGQTHNKKRKSIDESVIPNESQQKYSFNDDNIMTEGSAERRGGNLVRTNYPIEEENESQEDTARHQNTLDASGKHFDENYEKTRAHYQRPERFPGNYPEDNYEKPSPNHRQPKPQSSKKKQSIQPHQQKLEREQLKEFIKQNQQYLANAQKQRRVVYKDTNENNRQNDNPSPQSQKRQPYVDRFIKNSKQQDSSKPRQSNICENRQRSPHSDLDYSQDSQQHEQ